MRVIEIMFSPTGGTKKVSQIITSPWNYESKIIDLSRAESDFSKFTIKNNDTVVISMPVFGSRPPAIAIERLKQIDGNNAKCILICVYGNGDYGNTLAEMKDASEESGFQVIAAIAAIAQHSIIPEYASARPDESDEKQLTDFAKQILNKTSPISTKLETHLKEEMNKEEAHPEPPSEPPLPKPDETCTQCGLCSQTCPVQAITVDFVSDITKCIFCMRCVKQCPSKSREVNEEVISMAALALKKMCSIRKENELFL